MLEQGRAGGAMKGQAKGPIKAANSLASLTTLINVGLVSEES